MRVSRDMAMQANRMQAGIIGELRDRISALEAELVAARKVVGAAVELISSMSVGSFEDDPRMSYDEVQINKWELEEFKKSIAAYQSHLDGKAKG